MYAIQCTRYNRQCTICIRIIRMCTLLFTRLSLINIQLAPPYSATANYYATAEVTAYPNPEPNPKCRY